MVHWATQLPPWFWVFAGFVLGYWAAYIIMALANMAAQPATHVTITQHGGLHMITGVVKGGSGKFQATFNGALQAGAAPLWSAGDPSVVLAPAADGLTVDVVVPLGSAFTSFSLAVDGVSSSGSHVATSVSVPVFEPPPVPATNVVIDQIA
jgi:hypothetical protein